MRKVIYLLAIISLVGCTRVEKFEYSGHTYISFTTGSAKTRTMGVVHDPDCKCRIRKYQH